MPLGFNINRTMYHEFINRNEPLYCYHCDDCVFIPGDNTHALIVQLKELLHR